MDVPSISPESLYPSVGTASAPMLVDVRRDAAYEADETTLVGAVRRRPEDVSSWLRELPPGHQIVAYCVHGREVSQGVVASLRAAGIDARLLVGDRKSVV